MFELGPSATLEVIARLGRCWALTGGLARKMD